MPTEMPKDSLPFCEPQMDWKTSPTGEPACMQRIWVVTCASTQVWVGISQVLTTS